MDLNLENELKRLSHKGEVEEKLFHSYSVTKAYLKKDYYPWIQAKCPYYTDHGENHINNVINSASEMLSNRIGSHSTNPLKPIEIFEILNGIIWHDVGNAISRVNHEKKVYEISNEIRKLAYPDVVIQQHIVDISRSHTGIEGLKIPREEETVAFGNGNIPVYPRAYAAIVRFADEISENHNRISQSLLSSIPPENQIYWEYANCINACVADFSRDRILVTYEIRIEKLHKNFLCHSFSHKTDRNGKIPLISFIISRLEKMNNERVYCSRYFNGFSRFQNITARLTITDGQNRLPEYDNFEIILSDGGINLTDKYPSIAIYDDFFKKHPNWKPSAIKKSIVK
jgi:hypothetical protein